MDLSRPRFEVEIPMPNMSGGRIDNGNQVIAYTFVFDMDDYPTFIAIIRLSSFLVFLIGLIKMTPYLITW
jgi:hypothetical protein